MHNLHECMKKKLLFWATIICSYACTNENMHAKPRTNRATRLLKSHAHVHTHIHSDMRLLTLIITWCAHSDTPDEVADKASEVLGWRNIFDKGQAYYSGGAGSDDRFAVLVLLLLLVLVVTGGITSTISTATNTNNF